MSDLLIEGISNNIEVARMSMKDSVPPKQVCKYFSAKSSELKAVAQLAVCEHSALIGSHREEVQRIFLRAILPSRFSIGRGMVYGPIGQHSKECDIVVWDSQNYPSLPLLDHAFFFAESVRLIGECKSLYSTAEFSDVLDKCESIRKIMKLPEPSLADDIRMIKEELYAITHGIEHHGAIIFPYHIATSAIFLSGGDSLEAHSITDENLKSVDDRWPDAVLLLGPGRVLVKNYDKIGETGTATLDIFDLGDDALLVFTDALFRLLNQRSLQVEPPLRLAQHAFPSGELQPTASLEFPVDPFSPRRVTLW